MLLGATQRFDDLSSAKRSVWHAIFKVWIVVFTCWGFAVLALTRTQASSLLHVNNDDGIILFLIGLLVLALPSEYVTFRKWLVTDAGLIWKEPETFVVMVHVAATSSFPGLQLRGLNAYWDTTWEIYWHERQKAIAILKPGERLETPREIADPGSRGAIITPGNSLVRSDLFMNRPLRWWEVVASLVLIAMAFSIVNYACHVSSLADACEWILTRRH